MTQSIKKLMIKIKLNLEFIFVALVSYKLWLLSCHKVKLKCLDGV